MPSRLLSRRPRSTPRRTAPGARRLGLPVLGLPLLGLLLGLAPRPAAAQHTYLAVGDSVAFGYQDPTLTPDPPASAGFAGYAQPYDAFLSAQAGAPVTLLNLGIVGETSTSLVTPSAATAGNGLLNSNYSLSTPTTQDALLVSELTTLGSGVSNITVQVGANDILGLATSAAFQTAVATNNVAAQQSLLNGTLATIGTNYDTLLGQIHTLSPQADVQVLGYYNPYAALPETDPISVYLKAVSTPLNLALNAKIAQEAAAHGDGFVDLYTPFLGHESTLTLSGELIPTPFGPAPNDHPTTAGYAVITRQLEASAPVPEASTTVSLGLLLMLGLGGIVVAGKRRKSALRG